MNEMPINEAMHELASEWKQTSVENDANLLVENLEQYLPMTCDEVEVYDTGDTVLVQYVPRSGFVDADVESAVSQIHRFCSIVYAA